MSRKKKLRGYDEVKGFILENAYRDVVPTIAAIEEGLRAEGFTEVTKHMVYRTITDLTEEGFLESPWHGLYLVNRDTTDL